MRTVLMLALCLAALVPLGQAQYFQSGNDIRRSQLLNSCMLKFPTLAKLVSDPSTAPQTEGSMESCNSGCKAQFPKSRDDYLYCFSCCDMYYGQTARSLETGGPLIPKWALGQVPATVTTVTQCQFVTFPVAFPQGSLPRLHVQVTLASTLSEKPADLVYAATGGAPIWIEQIAPHGFKFCVAGVNASPPAGKVVNWLVLSDDEEFQGISGQIAVEAGSGTFCKTLAYGKRFEEPPVVLLTANHRNAVSQAHEALASWVTSYTETSFTACARELGGLDDNHDVFTFDFAAVRAEIRCPGYMYAGKVHAATLRVLKTSVAGQMCVEIPFPVAFPTRPVVFATLVSKVEGIHWVESVFTDSFVVCAGGLGRGAALDWANVSFLYFAQTKGALAENCAPATSV